MTGGLQGTAVESWGGLFVVSGLEPRPYACPAHTATEPHPPDPVQYFQVDLEVTEHLWKMKLGFGIRPKR